jgi:hypothetical protein
MSANFRLFNFLHLLSAFQNSQVGANSLYRVKGRPHYYSPKKEEYAVIKFSLSADLSSLFTWNTKQIFVYVSASWPNATSTELINEAVIWDTIITNPSADHLQNIGPAAMKKLVRSAKGKSIDPSRYVHVLNWREMADFGQR